jgi:type I restriction enzyme S subunit
MSTSIAELCPNFLEDTGSNTLPAGYKQTEVGVIPEDWEVSTIDECTSKVGSGKTPTGGSSVYVDSGRPFIRSQNVGWGKLDLSDVAFISEAIHLTFTGSELQESDILLNITGASIGRCAKADETIEGGNVNQHVCIIRTDRHKLLPTLLVELINSALGQNQIDSYQAGGNREGLNFSQVRQLRFAIPSFEKEQTAIANALSDVDALISELEKLIAKKQAIKTATMQQLLTGRTRLPQFALREDDTHKGTKSSELGEIPEDWEVVTLGDVGQTVIGLTYSPNDVADFGTLVLRSSNVQNGKLAYANNVYVNMALPERVIVKQGDILVCVRNGSRQLIGKCALIDKNAVGSAFGAFMSIFRTKYSLFMFYQFQSDLIQNQINETMGATINQITNKDMSGFMITLPLDEKEQTAIATILSDMDEEIQALEQRLSKTRQIKQGMMQELLTGRTRLVQPSRLGEKHAC